MNQNDFISAVAERTERTKTDVKEIVLESLATIQDVLVEGESIQFPGFGTFTTVERAARNGRNPSTGKAIKIAASTGVKFKVGATLKTAVKEG